ncbi:MAG TPA: AAA family ATPase, partial [Pirellulaceae bacterium]|nr:AAA family ATPase [Pirellulaceae bacterium]
YLVGMDRIWLEAECSRYEFFHDIVAQTSPDAVIINLDGDISRALSLVGSIKADTPQCAVIVVSADTDGQLILKTIRAGANEFLTSPIEIDELVSAIDRISQTGERVQRAKSGATIAVAGASGGVGCTTTAVNLACSLARNPAHMVVLVDLDLSLGDADVFLDSIPDYTLLEVCQNIYRLDLAMLRKSLTKHESGVYLLPRPVHLEDLNNISGEEFKKVVGLLKASFSHLVFDLSKSFNRFDIAAMQSAEHILLLTQLDLPCLRNVVRLLASFDSIGEINDKLKIVVNRSGLDKSQISIASAEETINRQIYFHIPNNFALIAECRNNGIPLITHAPKAAVTQAFVELAEKLCSTAGTPQPAGTQEKKEKKSWLKFLSK